MAGCDGLCNAVWRGLEHVAAVAACHARDDVLALATQSIGLGSDGRRLVAHSRGGAIATAPAAAVLSPAALAEVRSSGGCNILRRACRKVAAEEAAFAATPCESGSQPPAAAETAERCQKPKNDKHGQAVVDDSDNPGHD
ncbi:MAG: hypothetical protein CMM02_01770 [Rhodopirellula sp.]|nr:hypothetical protein [Rhodopirellula sp.]